MRRGANVVALIAGAAIAAGALGGCQGDADGPAPSPSESVASSAPPPSPSESTSPSPQAETAEEFIRRWVEVQNQMLTTGRTRDYTTLSRGCDPCDDTADRVRAIYKAGGQITTDGWEVAGIQRQGGSGRVRVFHVEIVNAPTSYTERAGGPIKKLGSGRPLMELTLRSSEDGFLVTDLAQVSQP